MLYNDAAYLGTSGGSSRAKLPSHYTIRIPSAQPSSNNMWPRLGFVFQSAQPCGNGMGTTRAVTGGDGTACSKWCGNGLGTGIKDILYRAVMGLSSYPCVILFCTQKGGVLPHLFEASAPPDSLPSFGSSMYIWLTGWYWFWHYTNDKKLSHHGTVWQTLSSANRLVCSTCTCSANCSKMRR